MGFSMGLLSAISRKHIDSLVLDCQFIDHCCLSVVHDWCDSGSHPAQGYFAIQQRRRVRRRTRRVWLEAGARRRFPPTRKPNASLSASRHWITNHGGCVRHSLLRLPWIPVTCDSRWLDDVNACDVRLPWHTSWFRVFADVQDVWWRAVEVQCDLHGVPDPVHYLRDFLRAEPDLVGQTIVGCCAVRYPRGACCHVVLHLSSIDIPWSVPWIQAFGH
mmetsp:Transcript_39708/g.55394  ORF Transcript_39708/g.55394 Transcript_39708/m.55394 type:complete len:217 (+) Transcript_39708:589-1239(+)